MVRTVPPSRPVASRPALLAAAAVLALLLGLAPAAPATAADEPDAVVVEDGVTQPVFSYADAIREVVQVTSPVSSHDGDEPDLITVDIIRPAASDGDLDVPTIVIPSPYYSGPGRGRQGEQKPTSPAVPSLVAGGAAYSGSRMTGSLPVTGQTGTVVDCGMALSPDDCPAGAEGAIALVERSPEAGDTANAAADATVTCSYTSPWEDCDAIVDGGDPASSNESPRWGTWPEEGEHTVELAWDTPRELSVSDLYWFQDSADGSDGGVKRAAEHRLEYWDGEAFVEVPGASGYPTELDTYNRTTFEPITTTRLRAVMTTRDDAQGVGLMEWKVYADPPGTGPDQVGNAVAAGAEAVVVFNDEEGPFAGAVDGHVEVPVLALSRADGLALRAQAADGALEAELRALVEPIDFFPLYYDNLFVPRGYAVALVDLPGSRHSTGCLDVGGPAEVGATEAVVEWLAGEGHAVDGTTGQPVTADWSNGLSALTGKSWDGTIPIAVAERAPEGLATIVPIAGLSHWHSDFWEDGARYGGSPTQWHDGNNDNPQMAGRCTEVRAHLAANEEDPDPDSAFWRERNWIDEVERFEASVFVVHGLNDYNVKPVNPGRLYTELVAHDVPRKMWLSQVAHEKAFDFRRDEWLDTIHRWYDRWLHGIDNGITDEPRVDVEHAPGEWSTYDDWPNGSTATRLWLGTPTAEGDPRLGTLTPDPRGVGPVAELTFQEVRRNVNQLAAAPFTDDDRRLAFLSPVLAEPLHVSGETTVTVEAEVEGEVATFSALLVDYGEDERVDHTTSGGIVDVDGETCVGEGTAADTGCYGNVAIRTHTADHEVVTRGWVHTGFHLGQALEPGRSVDLTWGLQHHDYVFEAGHRVGIVLAGPETHLHSSRHPTTGQDLTVALGASSVQLPVVGGPGALWAAFGYDGLAPVTDVLDDQDLGPAVDRRLRLAVDRVRDGLAEGDDPAVACRRVDLVALYAERFEGRARGVTADQAAALRAEVDALRTALGCGAVPG